MTPGWILEAVDVAANGFFGVSPDMETGSPDQL
jgi:hypothetical protein